MTFMLIVLASLLSCAGQLCQKQAVSRPAAPASGHLLRWLAASVLLLGLAMLVWLRVLQTTPIGLAYPMMSLNFILVAIAARWLWQEPVSLRHALGIVLIVAGVALMGSYT